MKRTFALSVVLALGMASTAVAAPRGSYKWLGEPNIGANWTPPPAAAVSHVIYLNNCQPNGCNLNAGYDNSTTNTSSIPDTTSTVSAYSGSASNWTALVNCVKQVYSPFDIQIVTERPTSGNYHMAIVAGTPQQVGMSSGVFGVSPFSCGYISNSISFTFANLAPSDIPELCWTVAQETAHSWGLDHKYDNRDPMTYLSGGPTIKQFQNEAGSCGEYSARGCQCNYPNTGSTKMNSFAVILGTFGSSAPDTVPPVVSVTFPTENTQVTPGFPVRATITDDRIIEKAELRLDGQLIGTDMEEPWEWQTPATLSQGKHKIEVKAYDRAPNVTGATVNVQYGTVCATASDCDAAGNVCLDGHCVAGPTMPGGLGTTCTSNADCSSMQCGNDGTNGYCVEACDLTADACPDDFACTDVGGGTGVCWPSEKGGCLAAGRSGNGAFILAIGLVALLITRKRRR